MAAGRLLIPGWARALDSDGAPIAAAVSLFNTGTDELAPVYSDEGLTVPLTNPVESNSAGRFPAIWASDTAAYDWSVVADYGPPGSPFTGIGLTVALAAEILAADAAEAAADSAEIAASEAETANTAAQAALTEILDIAESGSDAPSVVNKLNLNGSNIGANGTALRAAIGAVGSVELAAQGGSNRVGFLQSGTGAVATTTQAKLRSLPISTADWGITADSNGTIGNGTDWTTQLQALATYARANGRNVWVPAKPGSFIRFTGTINWAGGQTVTEVIGESKFDSAFFADFSSATAVAAFSNSATAGARSYVSWRNFRLQGRVGDSISNKVCGIYSNWGGEFSSFEDVFIYGFYDGALIANDYYVKFDRCFAWYCRNNGIQTGYEIGGAVGACNNLVFNGCHATYCGQNGLYAYAVRALSINGGAYEANSGSNVFLDSVFGGSITGLYNEYASSEAGNPPAQLRFRNCNGCTVNGYSASAFDNGGLPVIYVDEGCAGIILNGLAIETAGADTSAVGVLVRGSSGVQINGGFFDGMTTGVRLTESSRVTIDHSNILAATPVASDAAGNFLTWQNAIDSQVTASVPSINAGTPTNIIRTDLRRNVIGESVTFKVAALAANLALGGTKILINSELLSEQWEITEIIIGINDPFTGGGGDRNIQVRSSTTVYTTIPAASLAVYGRSARWGSTDVPWGASETNITPTPANGDLYAQYTGGAVDYAGGQVVFKITATRIA